jgi:hypothetical protein
VPFSTYLPFRLATRERGLRQQNPS